MELEKKYFEGLNADDDINLLAETDYINAENFRIGTTDVGSALRLESIGGTIHLHSLIPAPTHSYVPLCAVEDEERRRILYFEYYTQGTHQIRCHDRATNQNYTVLTQAQADLNFSKNKLIQAKVYGDLLIYTDDSEEIKIINIEAGIKLNHPTYVTDVLPYIIDTGLNTRIRHEDITLLRRPPIYAPAFTKEIDATVDLPNLIENEAFQFCYRYFYRDYQNSILGEWSKLANYNTVDESNAKYKFIRIKMPQAEFIPQTVLKVELIVVHLLSSKVQVIRTWDKEVDTDATAITNHNSGAAVLQYDFYNNKSGIDVPQAEQSKQEENIPRACKTLDTARKRLFLANYLEGFSSLKRTSMTVTIKDANTSSSISVIVWQAKIHYIHHQTDVETYYSSYWVQLPTITPSGWYEVTPSKLTSGTAFPVLPAPPTPIAYSALTWLGVDETAAVEKAVPDGNLELDHTLIIDVLSITITGLSTVATASFKSRSPYQAGIVFYDRLRRRIGMYTNDSLIFNIPDRTYAASALKSAIEWTLSNLAAASEIPEKAYYYGIVMTQNLRTRDFVQVYVDRCRYAKKEEQTGVITVDTTPTVPTDKTYIAIDLQSLLKDGLGYDFNEGDLARIYFFDGTTAQLGITLGIKGVQGRYALVEYSKLPTGLTPATPVMADVTFTSTMKMLVELWTPYVPKEQEFFYEVGTMYEVALPGTAGRTYGTTSGLISGDVYLLNRKSDLDVDYQAEAMSTNDKFWQRWFTDSGRAWEFIKNKEIRKPYSIAFSNVYVIGTQVNGLSAFELLDTEDVSPESGSIQKLLLTSKVQDDGTVMLVICYAETNTLYLGEAQISDAHSTAFFVKSVGVIGSINALRGSYGTQNAESVVLHRGQAFWYDAFNGCFVRYDVNGLFPISEYKMKRVAKLIGDQYLSMTQAQIEALGSRPFIFGGVDPHHNEVMWAIPKLATDPPKGYLMDYITYIDAKGYIGILDVGNDGDKIEVFVNDPVLGTLSLGVYIKQATDTTTAILAASIAAVINTNPYGYSATSQFAQITITARPGLGASMNGGGRLYTSITPVVVTNILKVGAGDKLLINATDKFII